MPESKAENHDVPAQEWLYASQKSIPQARNCYAREMLSESFKENVKRKGVIRPEDALRF